METEFTRIIDALPGAVWTAGPDGYAENFNQSWFELTGQTVQEASGRGWQAAMHPEDLPSLLQCWQSVVISGKRRETQARVRNNRFNSYRWLLLRVSPLAKGSSQVVNWAGYNTSFEERDRSEEAQGARWWLSWPAREGHFRSVADSIPALASLLTPGGILEIANHQTLEYFGKSLEEIQNSLPSELIHPEDIPAVTVAWNDAIVALQPFSYELRLRRADSVYCWFNTTVFPMHDTEGRVAVWYILQTNIDDRKQAEALLAGEKQVLEMVASGLALSAVLETLCLAFEDLAPDCACSVALVDDNGTHLNLGAAPSLPAPFADAINGRPISIENGPCAMASALNEQVFSPDVHAETRWQAYGWPDMALANGVQAACSTPIISRGGEVIGAFALHYARPSAFSAHQKDLLDRFTRLASISIERRRVEETLRRSEAYLTQAQSLSHTGSFGWTVSTDRHVWSEETFKLFEYAPTTTVTLQLVLDRAHPDDVDLVKQAIALGFAGQAIDYECRFQMPSGAIKHLHIVAKPTCEHAGTLEYIGAIRDVTESRAAEAALSKASTEIAHMARVLSLGTLTASIAHEVNQPLSGIITNASTCLRMLAVDPPNIEGAIETARRTIRDGNRASDVITRLRTLFANKPATTEPVDLNEVAQEVLALSASELQRRRIGIHPDFCDGIPHVNGDRIQLQQVIINLLLNASDAMRDVHDRPRQLRIKTERNQGEVRLSVRDSGVGLEQQEINRLFDAFYTTKKDGMGIGLAVSRSIIDAHRGRLWASPNDGPGATFTFSLPCGARSSADHAEVPQVHAGVAPDGDVRSL
jgi:PAS domain S-box-containing protein